MAAVLMDAEGGPEIRQPQIDSALSHRLPTVSASQALQGLEAGISRHVRTGLQTLDTLLANAADYEFGGFERGKVAELWGPTGSGKTALALQAATHALLGGQAVLWIDAKAVLPNVRLTSILTAMHASTESHRHFKRIAAHTLSHLLAVLLQPPRGLLQSGTALIVVNGLNTLLDLDYPRSQFATASKTEQQRWQAGRRYAVMGALISGMNKMAVLNDAAFIVTNGCSTRSRAENALGLALVPGLGGAEWENGVDARLALFRDFGCRFVGVQKCRGRSLISRDGVGETGRLVAFNLTSAGHFYEQQSGRCSDGEAAPQTRLILSPVKPRKRNLDEVADSDDEDVDEYGWTDTDDGVLVAESVTNDIRPALTLDTG